MIQAEITIQTCYGEAIIPVKVLGSGPRPGTAHVQALNGLAPFTRISHGGPYQESRAVVCIPNLRDIHEVPEPAENLPDAALSPSPRPAPEDHHLEGTYEDRTFHE